MAEVRLLNGKFIGIDRKIVDVFLDFDVFQSTFVRIHMHKVQLVFFIILMRRSK